MSSNYKPKKKKARRKTPAGYKYYRRFWVHSEIQAAHPLVFDASREPFVEERRTKKRTRKDLDDYGLRHDHDMRLGSPLKLDHRCPAKENLPYDRIQLIWNLKNGEIQLDINGCGAYTPGVFLLKRSADYALAAEIGTGTVLTIESAHVKWAIINTWRTEQWLLKYTFPRGKGMEPVESSCVRVGTLTAGKVVAYLRWCREQGNHKPQTLHSVRLGIDISCTLQMSKLKKSNQREGQDRTIVTTKASTLLSDIISKHRSLFIATEPARCAEWGDEELRADAWLVELTSYGSKVGVRFTGERWVLMSQACCHGNDSSCLSCLAYCHNKQAMNMRMPLMGWDGCGRVTRESGSRRDSSKAVFLKALRRQSDGGAPPPPRVTRSKQKMQCDVVVHERNTNHEQHASMNSDMDISDVESDCGGSVHDGEEKGSVLVETQMGEKCHLPQRMSTTCTHDALNDVLGTDASPSMREDMSITCNSSL